MYRPSAVIILLLTSSAAGQAQGTLAGSVQDDTGRPLPKITVSLVSRPPSALTYSVSQATGADGGFRFTGVPAGTYEVCPSVLATEFVNPCVAMSDRTFVSVRPSETKTLQPMRTRRVLRLQVRVDDPLGALSKAESVPYNRLIIRAAVAGFPPAPLLLIQETPGGRVYEMLVPRGAAVRLETHSPGVELVDEGARPLPVSDARDLATVADAVPVVLTVRGGRAQGR